MKTKRILAWLLILAMCIVLAACQPNSGDITESTPPAESTDVSTATPLLYRVTDEDGNVIWLFGSIHAGREDFYPLPDYVTSAFESADSLAVELDIVAFEKDISLQMKSLMPLVYRDGTTIRDHIPQDLYEKAVAILTEFDSYVAAMDSYCPAMWSSLIESLMLMQCGADINLGIDRHLIDLAYDAEKEIIEIESAEYQYTLLANFDNDLQTLLLESAVESYENKLAASVSLNTLMNVWASGDPQAFTAYFLASDSAMTEQQQQVYADYEQAMITDRNHSMAAFAQDALARGEEVFICVGAAHIVGEGAMADLLSQQGYLVEAFPEDRTAC